jgi:hypothetical protein
VQKNKIITSDYAEIWNFLVCSEENTSGEKHRTRGITGGNVTMIVFATMELDVPLSRLFLQIVRASLD